MNQDLKLKKLLKEEIKLILIEEGLIDYFKKKAGEYMGVAAVGTALGLLPAIAPEENQTQSHQTSTTSTTQSSNLELIKTVLPDGIKKIEDFERLDNEQFIAAIQLMIENIPNSGISAESILTLKDEIKKIINNRTDIHQHVKTALLRSLRNSD
jgi:hypothetical protein